MRLKVVILFLVFSLKAFSQSEKIEHLRAGITKLTGEEKVDVLNAIAYEFYMSHIHSDSSLQYAVRAYEEADKTGYIKGMVRSLVLQSEVEGRILDKLDRMEAKSLEAIELMKHEPVTGDLIRAYGCLGLAKIWLGKFDEAQKVLERARTLALRIQSNNELAWITQLMGLRYLKQGKYWQSFQYLIEASRMGKEFKDSLITSFSLALIARAYNYNGDPKKAIEYYLESIRYRNSPIYYLYPHMEDLGLAYLKLQQFDSAVYYQQLQRSNILATTTDEVIRKKFSFWQLPDFRIDAKVAEKKYGEVIKFLLPVVSQDASNRDVLSYMHALLNIGRAYEGLGNYKSGILYTRKLLTIANATSNHHFQKDGNELMANLYEKLNNSDSAYVYFKTYSGIKEEMDKEQFALRTSLYTASSEANTKMDLLQREKLLNESQLSLKEKQLQKQSQLQSLLLGSIGVLVLISILIFRNIVLKRKNEKLQNEQEHSALKRKALELEMQALRAQMNPHFIFNCLNAIDNLIQTNQADKATSYLSRFAKLIRSVLDSSKNNLVSFQRDFETLKLYLEMEKFRCNNKFNFSLTVDDKLMNGDYKVPPLIIQPFVENAIHHGLLNKQDNNRQLEITAQVIGEQIVYNISDNGIGRKQAQVFKNRNRPEQKSYGIDITRERINLYNQNGDNDIEILDLVENGQPLGTTATIRINS